MTTTQHFTGREKIEEMFDEKFVGLDDDGMYKTKYDDEIMDFIFEEVIPEVLRSTIPFQELPDKYIGTDKRSAFLDGYVMAKIESAKKAKELYGIEI